MCFMRLVKDRNILQYRSYMAKLQANRAEMDLEGLFNTPFMQEDVKNNLWDLTQYMFCCSVLFRDMSESSFTLTFTKIFTNQSAGIANALRSKGLIYPGDYTYWRALFKDHSHSSYCEAKSLIIYMDLSFLDRLNFCHEWFYSGEELWLSRGFKGAMWEPFLDSGLDGRGFLRHLKETPVETPSVPGAANVFGWDS